MSLCSIVTDILKFCSAVQKRCLDEIVDRDVEKGMFVTVTLCLPLSIHVCVHKRALLRLAKIRSQRHLYIVSTSIGLSMCSCVFVTGAIKPQTMFTQV